jgi:branched-chain amino acid transport system substrate-binding protein
MLARRLFLLTSLIFAVAMPLGGGRAEVPPAPSVQPIKVIAGFNLTGPEAALDLPSYQGALLAVEQRNAAGGVLGRPLQLIAVDTASNPATVSATMGAALARHPDVVAGIGYSYSTFALEAGRLFQAAGRPFITSGATAPDLPDQVGNQMFLAAYGDDAQARVMATFARDQLRIDHAALWIDDGFVYTRTVGAFFAINFPLLGGTLDKQTYPAGEPDLPALIAAFNAGSPKPRAIYAASMPRTAVELIGQVRGAGIGAALLSGDGWDSPDLVEASREKGLTGIYFTTHRFLDVETKEMQAFVAAYRQRFGEPPATAFAPLGFDTVNLLVNAIQRAGSADPMDIRTALADTQGFPGVVGTISYAPGRRVPDKAVSVIRLDRGNLTPVWTWTPEVKSN